MKLILMSYKNTLLKLVYYLQLESHATPILAFAIHLEVYYFHICIVMPLLLKSFLFILLIPQKQCNCILQEYTRLTLPAHWNSCWSARYWYANALISTFRLHLTLNRTEIGSRSHVSAADVTRVFEIHGFSNHTSVYSSSFHFGCSGPGAETRTKTHRHEQIVFLVNTRNNPSGSAHEILCRALR